jgi:hypothetical protein
VEARRAEGEDPAVERDEPVPATARVGGDADDLFGQAHRTGRPEEAGVAEGEHATVGRDQPVTAT